jgi:fructoselysine 6-kinase
MKVASVGDSCIDIYTNQDNLVSVGGNGVNLAVAVRRSGVDCSFIGMVGDDENGRVVREVLEREGVDVSCLTVRAGMTGWCRIRLEEGDRVMQAEDLGVQHNYELSERDFKFVSGHEFVHYTGFTNWPTAYTGGIKNYFELVSSHVRQFHSFGIPVSMDFSDGDMSKLLEAVAGKVSVGFFSRPGSDDESMTVEAKRLWRYGFELVVLTRGEKGSCAYDGNECVFQDIVPVEVVDPLGAGDASMGAFISKWIKHEPLKECLYYASWYAAQVCGRFGGF